MKAVTLSDADRKSVRAANARALSNRAKNTLNPITAETRWSIVPRASTATRCTPEDERLALTRCTTQLPESLAQFVRSQARKEGKSAAEIVRFAVCFYQRALEAIEAVEGGQA